MKCCQDCINKYNYDNMNIFTQPCDVCENYSEFKEIPTRYFSIYNENKDWQYMKMTARIIRPDTYRFNLTIPDYDTSLNGAVYEKTNVHTNAFHKSIISKDYTYNFEQLATKSGLFMSDIQLCENINILKFVELVSKEIFSSHPSKDKLVCKVTMDISPYSKNKKLYIYENIEN